MLYPFFRCSWDVELPSATEAPIEVEIDLVKVIDDKVSAVVNPGHMSNEENLSLRQAW